MDDLESMGNVLRIVICGLIVCVGLQTAAGQAWNDYTLKIDSGFKISRANNMDIDLVRIGNSPGDPLGDQLVYSHRDYAGVGPINGYFVTPTHIFTRHLGRVKRNLFQGDTFENVDPSQTFYFVVDKAAASVSRPSLKIDGITPDEVRAAEVFGPFDEQAFLRQPSVQAAGQVKWVEPSNPHPLTPIGPLSGLPMISAQAMWWSLLTVLLIIGAGSWLWGRRQA